MSYTTAKKLKTENHEDGSVSVFVEFAQDGSSEVLIKEIPRVQSFEDLQRKSKAILDNLNLEKSLGSVSAINVTPVPVTPVEPTAEEEARRQYFKDYNKLVQLKEVQKNVTEPKLDADVSNLETLVASEYKPEYYD